MSVRRRIEFSAWRDAGRSWVGSPRHGFGDAGELRLGSCQRHTPGNGGRLPPELDHSGHDERGEPHGERHTEDVGAMLNVDLDLPLPLSPYFGIGAGQEMTGWSNTDFQAPGIGQLTINDPLGSLRASSHQRHLGPVSGRRRAEDHRRVPFPGRDGKAAGSIASRVLTFAREGRCREQPEHSILIGLRYRFGAARARERPEAYRRASAAGRCRYVEMVGVVMWRGCM